MTKPNKQPPPAPLALTHDELVVINNALNEVCNGLAFEDDEFQTRIGFSRAMARDVLKKIASALATQPKP
jgi:hypothetical protein